MEKEDAIVNERYVLRDIFEEDDLDFYEKFLLHLSEDEQVAFFKEFPEFLQQFRLKETEYKMLQDKDVRDQIRAKMKRDEKNDL